jgi:NADH-quinone oxidoreductase subunit H
LFQNFNDFFKLLGKEIIIVKEGVHTLFVIAPFIGFAMLVLVTSILGTTLFYKVGFGGDLIVVMYLLMIYSISIILGGTSTGNVYSSIGAGREIKLLIADELVFILVCLVAVIKSGYTLQFNEIISVQAQKSPFINSISGIISVILAILCIQAKMALPPFHIPEAETELVEGPLMEYSGTLLAFWKLNSFMMYVTFPFLLIVLFWGGFDPNGLGILWFALKYLLLVVLIIIIKNTNPRIRIDTALNFFWKYASVLALIAVVLAVYGW